MSARPNDSRSNCAVDVSGDPSFSVKNVTRVAHDKVRLPGSKDGPGNVGWFPMRDGVEFVEERRRFLAFHKDASLQADTRASAFEELWFDVMNILMFDPDFTSAGLPMWRALGIKVPVEGTAALVGNPGIDAITAECVQAALLNTFNTAMGPVDMQSATFAIASFIRAHPSFKHFNPPGKPFAPYGDETRYGLVSILDPTF